MKSGGIGSRRRGVALVVLDVGEGDLRRALDLVVQHERRRRHEDRGAVEVLGHVAAVGGDEGVAVGGISPR